MMLIYSEVHYYVGKCLSSVSEVHFLDIYVWMSLSKTDVKSSYFSSSPNHSKIGKKALNDTSFALVVQLHFVPFI